MTKKTILTPAFSSCANDATDSEQDAMLRLILLILLQKDRAVAEYSLGNYNIGTGYHVSLNTEDILNLATPLPSENIHIRFLENNLMHTVEIDLSVRSATKGLVYFDAYHKETKFMLPVPLALELILKRNGNPSPEMK